LVRSAVVAPDPRPSDRSDLYQGDSVSDVFPVLLYDGDCAFCTSSVNVLRRHVRPRADLQPWQRADLEHLGVSAEQCRTSIQWISSPGAPALTRGRAVAAVLKVGRQPWPAVSAVLQLPGVASAVDLGYRLVAANRHRLPGSTPACRLPEAPTAAPTEAPNRAA
jgi:predicted DCC family thiol-disulfide oxidoreductase YuxK